MEIYAVMSVVLAQFAR